MSLQPVEIPEGIDGLPYLILWEFDEIGVIICIFYLGMFTKAPLYLTAALLFVFLKLYMNQKKKYLAGFYRHKPYRWGLFPLNKYFPNGAIKEYKE